jgi:hypothetical protein
MHECTIKGAQAVRKLAPQTGRGKSSVMETLFLPAFVKPLGIEPSIAYGVPIRAGSIRLLSERL